MPPGGWAAFESESGNESVGIYWENRNENVALEPDVNAVRSAFPFSIPAGQDIRGRAYLLFGSGNTVRGLAKDLDDKLPPFGRIDDNQIDLDTRHVHLRGWALDNKGIRSLELWVDGKKAADLELNEQRDDICAIYPGYTMCVKTKTRVGFSFTYPRPAGTGCEKPVEVRATDTDGNSRVIARTSISPVAYQ